MYSNCMLRIALGQLYEKPYTCAGQCATHVYTHVGNIVCVTGSMGQRPEWSDPNLSLGIAQIPQKTGT